MPEYVDLPPVPEDAITSTANPRVRHLVELRKRRTRDLEGITLVDGFDELSLALDAQVAVRTLYVCPDLVTDVARLGLVERLVRQGVDVVRLGREAFTRASYRESPDGWLAVVPAPGGKLSDLALPKRPLVLVAESIEKPGNLGAILRTAEAAGVHAVISSSPVTDWGNPNVVRASKGTVFAVPVAVATTAETIAWVRSQGLSIVVATPDTDVVVTDLDLTGATAIVVGAEHDGVSSEWRTAADTVARIPMSGVVNSLNVAISAAVVVFEAVRQRAGSD